MHCESVCTSPSPQPSKYDNGYFPPFISLSHISTEQHPRETHRHRLLKVEHSFSSPDPPPFYQASYLVHQSIAPPWQTPLPLVVFFVVTPPPQDIDRLEARITKVLQQLSTSRPLLPSPHGNQTAAKVFDGRLLNLTSSIDLTLLLVSYHRERTQRSSRPHRFQLLAFRGPPHHFALYD